MEENMVTENPVGIAPAAQTGSMSNTEVVAPAPTLDTKSADANIISEQIKAEYEKQIQKINADLNSMKSTFQRNEALREKEWKSRESDYIRQLEHLKLSSMDDEQRKAYEADSERRRYQEMQQRVAELEQANLEISAMQHAKDYFIQNGVPVEKLTGNQDYDSLWNTGMQHIVDELKRYKEMTSQAQTSVSQQPAPPTAPTVVVSNGVPSTGGPTWDDLKKQYGDEDTVYRLVETGQLPASIIPIPPQYRVQ